MKIAKAILLSILLILIVGILLFASRSNTVSWAQTALTPTPSMTPSTRDMDLLEEFTQALTYETGPGYVEGVACELPCWWGMTPGVTPEEDVIEILQTSGFYRNWNQPEPFDSSNGPIGGSIYLSLSPDVFGPFSIGFGAENGKLSQIAIRINKPNKWFPTDTFDLSHVINAFDQDPVIYVHLSRADFTIILTYPGVILYYDYHFINEPDRFVVNQQRYITDFIICSKDDIVQTINVILFDPSDQEFLDSQVGDSTFVVPLEERIQINTKTFVDFFRETPDQCLEVPLKSVDE